MKPRRYSFVDSSKAEIDQDGTWDLTLSNGRHVRGKAADADEALMAVNAAHDQFVLQQWAKGKFYHDCRFLVPLT